MISLDQVLLLEEKVESAVQKIAQLKAENDALRTKCAELTNSLCAKTEQLSSFATDQNKIEEGILKALNRLNSVENSVLKTAALAQAANAAKTEPQPVLEHADVKNEQEVQATAVPAEQETAQKNTQTSSLFDNPVSKEEPQNPEKSTAQEPPAAENGQFDIF